MFSFKEYIIEAKKAKEKMDIENRELGTSLLDSVLNGEINTNDESFKKIFHQNGPMIYAFITPKVKDAVKVGFTDQAPEKRIDQWRKVYDDKDNQLECIGYWSSEEFNTVARQKQFFWDHAVHKKLEDKKFHQFKDADDFYKYIGDELHTIHHSREFFKKYSDLDGEEKEELSEQMLIDLITQMKKNIAEGHPDFKVYSSEDNEVKTTWGEPAQYNNTKLQQEAVNTGVEALNTGKTKLLMAAVMRFGKTHASYDIVKNGKIDGKPIRRVLVTSAKADVRAAWRDDINHKNFIDDFVFVELKGSKLDLSYRREGDKVISTQTEPLDKIDELYDAGKTIIVFDTLHDLGGSIKALKSKHIGVMDKEFDMMIIDETHYGSHASLFGQVTGLTDDTEEDYKQEEKGEETLTQAKADANFIKDLSKNCKTMLQVSGTPYYILASNEFLNDNDTSIISKVSYTDMINARDEWEKENPHESASHSPYFGIPTLHKIGLRLTDECIKAAADKDISTNISKLFEVKGKKFVHEKAIISLMKSVFGDDKSDTLGFLKNKQVEGSKTCRHTMAVLPMCKDCHLLKDLLLKNNIINEKERQIIVLVDSEFGHSDVTDSHDLNNKLQELDKNNKKSLVLTVKKYLTGVSMPMLDSMLYLKNAKSPQEYDQAIFRLCTRNTSKVKNNDGETMTINRKHNVYLIDFNIANMFNMLANSARMKADAENNPTMDRVKELMGKDLESTPVFCEDTNGEILGKMKSLNRDDLMKFYTNFNSNKTIEEMINDDINDRFRDVFTDNKLQSIIDKLTENRDKSKNKIEAPDANDKDKSDVDIDAVPDNAEVDDEVKPKDKTGHKPFKEFSKEEKNAYNNAKEKFKSIVKYILYCNICCKEPFPDIDTMIKKADDNKEFENKLKNFKISIDGIKEMYNAMDNPNKVRLNEIVCRISILAEDMSKTDIEKFQKSLEGMGRLSDSEVPTPAKLVEKMLDKIPEEEYKKAESILLVRELQGEFLQGINKKFGKDVVKKCKVVPGSLVAKELIEKCLNSMGLGDYINDIIIPVEDRNDNNLLYDDFLGLDNEKILKKWNMGKKFDICLQNPPYGSVGNDVIHLKFVDKCLDIADKQVTVMPFTFVTKLTNKTQNKFKEKLSNYMASVEEISSTVFNGPKMPNVGIYVFDDNKNEDTDITINYIKDNKELNVHSLLDISNYSEKDTEIINIIEKHGTQTHLWGGGHDHVTVKSLAKKGITDEKKVKELINDNIKENLLQLPKNKTYLVCSHANGSMNARFISVKNGQIFTDFDELVKFMQERNISSGYQFLIFNNKIEAENCKKALQNPLLRWTCYKLQDDQGMSKCYKYIPAIDWSDDRVKTDEGLLEVCGCPKDKAKEYAEYCKNIISKVDKGERP